MLGTLFVLLGLTVSLVGPFMSGSPALAVGFLLIVLGIPVLLAAGRMRSRERNGESVRLEKDMPQSREPANKDVSFAGSASTSLRIGTSMNDLGATSSSLASYTDGEQIKIAGMVFWNVVQVGAKRSGLANNPTPRAKDLALGIAFGAAGVLASHMLDRDEPAYCTCAVGILAVGEHRVFLLKLGRVGMIGESAANASLPSELMGSIPTSFSPTEVAAFRPLSVSADGQELRVHLLGEPRSTLDTAFCSDGSCLSVRTGDPFKARSIATAIEEFSSYPLPEQVISSLLVADSPSFSQREQSAFAEIDYFQSFVPVYRHQKKEVRRAFVLAARKSNEGLNRIGEACARSFGRGSGNSYFITGFGLLLLSPWALFMVMGIHDFALGNGIAAAGSPDASDVAEGIFGLLIILGASSLALVFLYGVGWSDMRERRLERRLSAEGGGMGGSLDPLLALLAWDKDWRARLDWNEIENALASDPRFAPQLCETLRGITKQRQREFVMAAPSELRMRLIGRMLEPKGAISLLATALYVSAWLPCLALGIYVASSGILPGSPSAGGWLLFIFGPVIGFGGGPVALVLCIAQAIAWRYRRWVAKRLRAQELST